ncbi:MAG: 2-C-methyl-D-erythritol 4-phosphate cytidylyltransferase [Dehalobacterium sp.]
MSYITAVIPAAGQGSRMGAGVNKQFLKLSGKPVLVHTLEIFEKCELINDIVLIASSGEEEYCHHLLKEYGLSKITRIVTGGQERQHSVARGLAQVSHKCDIVAVHDGARPLLLLSHLNSILQAVSQHDGVVLAVPVKDTIKESRSDKTIKCTLDRSRLWMVQTPQVFKKDVLIYAYEKAMEEGFNGTDDASLAEHYGFKIKVVEGSYENIKITTPEDLDLAELIFKRRR